MKKDSGFGFAIKYETILHVENSPLWNILQQFPQVRTCSSISTYTEITSNELTQYEVCSIMKTYRKTGVYINTSKYSWNYVAIMFSIYEFKKYALYQPKWWLATTSFTFEKIIRGAPWYLNTYLYFLLKCRYVHTFNAVNTTFVILPICTANTTIRLMYTFWFASLTNWSLFRDIFGNGCECGGLSLTNRCISLKNNGNSQKWIFDI